MEASKCVAAVGCGLVSRLAIARRLCIRFPMKLFAFALFLAVTSMSAAPEATARGAASDMPAESAGETVTLFKPSETRDARRLHAGLVGVWYGDQPGEGGARQQRLMRRNADGTFVVAFRVTYPDGRVEKSEEYGEWGVSGGLLLTLTRGWIKLGMRWPIEKPSGYFWDAYRVNTLTRESFDYTSLDTGNHYQSRRVEEDFKLE